MNEEYWITVTSSEESCDSDKIDSDIEAELYSSIHHETTTARTSTDLSNTQSPQVKQFLPLNLAPDKSPVIKYGSVSSDTYTSFVKVIEDNSNINVKDKSDTSVSFKSPEIMVNKNYSNKVQRKSDTSGYDLHTSSKTLDGKVVKDYSNLDIEEMFDASVNNLYTSFETPEKKKSDASLNELCTSLDSSKVKGYSNTNAKRKSDILINNKSEGNIDGNSRKKPKVTSREKLKKESERTSVLNGSFVCDSSDSDSITWSEVDICKIELQTNVEPEIVALSSDSFSDESSEPFEEICSFRRSTENSLQPSTSNSSNDLWHINSDDLYRSKGRSKSSRYHERAVLKCTNCKQNGHTVKFCSVPKNVRCYLCGGSHTSMGCNHKVCSRCFQRGHDTRFCRQRFVDLCILCNMRGHSVKYCPDLWRRYHLTTNQGNIVVANPVSQDSPIYCFNCGEQGHYGAECQLLRPDRNHFQTWTSVIAHVHPSDTIKRMMEDQRHVALGGVPAWPINQHRVPLPPAFPRFPTPTQKKKKKKKNSNSNDNTQITRSAKRKKNKASSASQTPENISKTQKRKEIKGRMFKRKEFNFPRTPKSARRQGPQRFEKEPFMNGLHRRLGLNPQTGLPNNGLM